MHIRRIMFAGRRAWEICNGRVAVAMTEGGGHLVSLTLDERPGINPLWQPTWPTIEPWAYRRHEGERWGGSPLLASVAGHLLCLPCFGSPSEAEARLGRDGHGEAPLARWKIVAKSITAHHARLQVACELPVAGIRVVRSITLRPQSRLVDVVEELTSLVDRDQPYTMSEHVTFGPPFLQKGVTVFDMPAVEGHTFPVVFGRKQRLRVDTAFTWPVGPGADGTPVDLRTLAAKARANSDFTTQHIDAERADGWFSALNARLGLLVVYHWRRADFPWVGSWEENHCRLQPPWNGNSLTRGMEFANTPFPTSLREQVGRGRMHGDPTFAWLPARGTRRVAYRIALLAVAGNTRGVTDVRPSPAGLDVDLAV